MTTDEVCTYLGLSRPTVFKRIRDNKLHPLPKLNPNRDKEPLRFDRAEVERLAAPRPQEGTPGAG